FQPVAHRLEHLALAFSAHGRIEAGVENDRTGWPNDRPNIEVERLQHVVRVAADEVFCRFAIVMPVADGIDFMRVVAHWLLSLRVVESARARRDHAYGALSCAHPGRSGRAARNAALLARCGASLRQRGAGARRADLDPGTAFDRLHH